MRVFVTGATGAIGIPAVKALVAAGHDVAATARSPEKAEQVRALGATPVEVDLFDPAGLKEAVAGHDAVANLATKIPPTAKAARPKHWAENERIRREGSKHIADAVIAQGVDRLIQESVSFAYTDSGDRFVDESEPFTPPEGLDGMAEAEANARRVTDAGRTGVVLRFGNFYGPGAGHSIDMAKAVKRHVSPLLGDQDGYWPVIHLDDAGAAVAAALEAPAGTYNVVDDEALTKAELAAAIADALGVKSPRAIPGAIIRLVEKRTNVLTRSVRATNARFKEATGWQPRYPTAHEGWPATVAALREQGAI